MRNLIRNLLFEMPTFNDEDKGIDKLKKDKVDRKGTLLFTENVNEYEYQYYEVMFNDRKYLHGYVDNIKNSRVNAGYIECEMSYYKLCKDMFMQCHPTLSKFPVVVSIAIYDSYKGKGLGIAFYEHIINHFGGIVSDITLTGKVGVGSFQIWQKLSKKYEVYIIKDNGKLLRVKEITPELMGRNDERFVAIK